MIGTTCYVSAEETRASNTTDLAVETNHLARSGFSTRLAKTTCTLVQISTLVIRITHNALSDGVIPCLESFGGTIEVYDDAPSDGPSVLSFLASLTSLDHPSFRREGSAIEDRLRGTATTLGMASTLKLPIDS